MDVDAVEAACRAGRVPGLVYTIPNFQNPGGMTLSRAKRERLVALAREHGFLVLEDDPYGELRFDGDDEPRLFALDEGAGHVIYSTSFTKTVAPGLRTGAMVLPPQLHATLRKLAIDTYIGPTMLSEATVAQYCAAGAFEPGVERMRRALARAPRRAAWRPSTRTSATASATSRRPAATSSGSTCRASTPTRWPTPRRRPGRPS